MFRKPPKIDCRQNTVPAYTDSVLAGIIGFWTLTTRMALSQKTVAVGQSVPHTNIRDPDGVYVLNIKQQLGAAAALSTFPKHIVVSIKSMKQMGLRETGLNCTKSTAWNASSSPWCSESG